MDIIARSLNVKFYLCLYKELLVKIILIFMTISLRTEAFSAIECIRKTKKVNADNAIKVEFTCGRESNSFLIGCDLTTDPIETGKGWISPYKVKWVKHGDNEGIEGKFGFFASCTKVSQADLNVTKH